MDHEYSVDEALLWRYFEKAVSRDEKAAVETWINSSEENKRLAGKIARIYFSGSLLHAAKESDAREQLDKLWKKWEHKRMRFVWKRIMRAVAMLFLPLLLLSVFYIVSGRRTTNVPEQMVEVRTQVGITNSIVLPDSSIVYLNSESCLKYPAHFTRNRNVYLKGEAYFIVKKQNKSRFMVHTAAGVRVEVLGTEFNVRSNEQEVDAVLVKGSVKFVCPDSRNGEKDIRIIPGQKISYLTSSGKIALSEADIDAEIGWRDGRAVFKNCPLPEALEILSKRFHAEFIVKNEALKKNSFTGSFKNQSLEQILENFSLSSHMKYRYIKKREPGSTLPEREIIELY